MVRTPRHTMLVVSKNVVPLNMVVWPTSSRKTQQNTKNFCRLARVAFVGHPTHTTRENKKSCSARRVVGVDRWIRIVDSASIKDVSHCSSYTSTLEPVIWNGSELLILRAIGRCLN